jgi:adenosylhomocysteine nucleosidase
MVIVARDVMSDSGRFAADVALGAAFGGITGQTVLAGTAVVADAATKRALLTATGAQAVDLESGAVVTVARAFGLPFAVVRAVCDPAERDLPPAALVALNPDGAIGAERVLWSLVRRPGQILELLAVGRDAFLARRGLVAVARRFSGR